MVNTPAADNRRGVNCSLSFVNAAGRRRSFGIRATVVTWGLQVVADESQSRMRRVMYPKQVLPSQFMVTPALITYSEFVSLMDFLTEYALFVTDVTLSDAKVSRMMTVTCTARAFKRKGLLTTGIERGNHVGAMVWSPSLVFETLVDPLEKNSAIRGSSFHYGDAAIRHANPDLEAKYFYPLSAQLGGSQQGEDFAAVQEPNQGNDGGFTTGPGNFDGDGNLNPNVANGGTAPPATGAGNFNPNVSNGGTTASTASPTTSSTPVAAATAKAS